MKLIEEIMEPETTGDPMGKSLNWTRKSTYSLSKTLKGKGINISPNTAGKALKAIGYSLKLNRKSISTTQHPDRDQQFQFIESKVKEYEDMGQPIISVDTKKKEMIGNFSNKGRKYGKEAEKTMDHDFLSNAIGKISPYGIYEKLTGKGTVVLGTSSETPEFAVDAIETWLTGIAYKRYSDIRKLLILWIPVAVMVIENMDGNFFFIPNYLQFMALTSRYAIILQGLQSGIRLNIECFHISQKIGKVCLYDHMK